VSFAGAGDPAGVPVAPGSYTIDITDAGSNGSLGNFTIATSPGQTSLVVKAGALDSSKGEPLRLLLIHTHDQLWMVTTVMPTP
jgi:hypothetical protein